MDQSTAVPRRRFLAGVTSSFPVISTFKNTSNNQSVSGDVTQAIQQSRSYIFETATGDQYTYWDTHVKHGTNGHLRNTLFFALLLAEIDRRTETRDRCVTYLLDHRTEGGGWDDPVTNFGGLLLLGELLDEDYSDEETEIQSEIDEKGQQLTDNQGESATVTNMFRIRLMYAAMSDEYSYSELFPRDLPNQLGQAISVTEAFDGETISATGHLSRHGFMGYQSAYYLIGSAASSEEPTERDRTLRRCLERVILARQLTRGTWGASTPTVFAVVALLQQGHEPSDDRLQHPVDWLADNRVTDDGRVEIWRLPVWDTGHLIDALLESGLSTTDNRLKQAAQWLYRARNPQQVANPLEVTVNRSPAPFREQSQIGWGWRASAFTDWDDTALAVNVLSEFMEAELSEEEQLLLDVQNSDGSWSTFLKDFDPFDEQEAERIKPNMPDGLYRLFFGRVTSPDVTGGVLSALAKLDYTVNNSDTVSNAIDYLDDARADNNLWLGVWGQGFTYATGRVLRGLGAVDIDTERSLVQDAIAELTKQQNNDGGWGEDSKYQPGSSTPLSVPYQSADSTPTQTGWVLKGLLSVGVSPEDEVIQNGIDYLLRTQRSDGSWPVDRVMYNYGGPLYSTGATTQAAGLKALAMYAKKT